MALYRRGVFTIGPNWQPMSDPHEAERLARAQLQAQISAGLRAEEAADQRAALDAVISGQELGVKRNDALFSGREEKRLALEKEERANFAQTSEFMNEYALEDQRAVHERKLEKTKADAAIEKRDEGRRYTAGLLRDKIKRDADIASGKVDADAKRKEHADMTQELAKSDLIKELAKRPEQYWPSEEEGDIRGDSPEWSTIQNSMSLLSSDLIHRYKHDDTKRGLIEDLKRNIGLFLTNRLRVYEKLKGKASQDYIKSSEGWTWDKLLGDQAEGLREARREIPQKDKLQEELSNIRHIIGSFPGLHNDPYLNGLIQNIQKVINA